MDFKVATPADKQEISQELYTVLKRVHTKAWHEKGMTFEQVAGKNGKGSLSQTLNYRRNPSPTDLWTWCNSWCNKGVIDEEEVMYIMLAAGHVDVRDQRKAVEVISQKYPSVHVRTDELPPVPAQANTEPVQCSADDAYRASIAAIPTVKVTEADAERMRELKNAGIW